MKRINIKKSYICILVLTVALGMVSCVGDLDVTPIDPSVTQTFDQDAVFAKIYASLALTGQEGPSGTPDLDADYIDEGTSAFVRLLWNFNELASDEAICSWGDPGIPEMNFCQWTSSHEQLKGLYARLYFIVTLTNHFLEETDGQTDDTSVKQRAEARYIRAMSYYYLMDLFGNVPFTTIVSTEAPEQIQRADLYTWIESELLDIESDMYEPKQAPYYRVDQAADWLLLSRMYLNAEVYTGTAQWEKAATYAKKVIDSGYSLASEYKYLFMADNASSFDGSTVNDAANEIILPIAADGVKTYSWGSSLFLIASIHTSGMPDWGTSEGWGGNRARAALVKKFFSDGTIPSSADLTDLTTAANDDRAMLFADSRTVEITKYTVFKQGLSVMKFQNIRADGGETNDTRWVDMDVPFMRLAEAYLTYAEATFRNGGSTTTVLSAINTLRTRANATSLTTIDLDGILDEWSREFYFEGRRRSDLIRFDYYGGSTYNWDWKGGVAAGTTFSKIYNLMPIPSADMNANSNLVQNEGY
jgi:starch-binding outer membrane protein, SusD/RagB family